MTELGTIVRQARQRSGISQGDLAIRAGTSQAAVSLIESGRREPTFERFAALLVSLGWRAELELVSLAEPDTDRRQLAEADRLTPSERLERGAAWSKLAASIQVEPGGG